MVGSWRCEQADGRAATWAGDGTPRVDLTTRLWRASLAFDAPPLKGAQSGSPVFITQPAQGPSAARPAMTGRPRACSRTSSSRCEQASTSSGLLGALVIAFASSPYPSNIFSPKPARTKPRKHCGRLRQAVAVSPAHAFVCVRRAAGARMRHGDVGSQRQHGCR